MSGENPTVDDPNTPPVVAGAATPTDDVAAQLAAAQTELEAERAKNAELTPLAQAAREAEEAQKSELQKLQEAQAERDKTISTQQSEITRLSLAQTYGLAPEDLGLLGSGTSEEMETNAKRLQELHAAAAVAEVGAPPSQRPIDSLKPGSSQKPPLTDDSYPSHWD